MHAVATRGGESHHIARRAPVNPVTHRRNLQDQAAVVKHGLRREIELRASGHGRVIQSLQRGRDVCVLHCSILATLCLESAGGLVRIRRLSPS